MLRGALQTCSCEVIFTTFKKMRTWNIDATVHRGRTRAASVRCGRTRAGCCTRSNNGRGHAARLRPPEVRLHFWPVLGSVPLTPPFPSVTAQLGPALVRHGPGGPLHRGGAFQSDRLGPSWTRRAAGNTGKMKGEFGLQKAVGRSSVRRDSGKSPPPQRTIFRSSSISREIELDLPGTAGTRKKQEIRKNPEI